MSGNITTLIIGLILAFGGLVCVIVFPGEKEVNKIFNKNPSLHREGFFFEWNYMNFEKFKNYAAGFNLIPVYEVITADMLTPVLAYLKIRNEGEQSFLLESVEGTKQLARYSFIGKNPVSIISNKGMKIEISINGTKTNIQQNLFDYLKETLKKYKQPQIEELPDFTGGIVGYIGYENICLIEKVVNVKENKIGTPDSILGIYKTILAFDHYKHQIILISNVLIDENSNLNYEYNLALTEINNIKKELRKPIEYSSGFQLCKTTKEHISDTELKEQILLSKNNICEGDIFQIVLSKRFSAEYKGDLFNVYRALRVINPSPYMYYLEFNNDFTIVGTSPEDLVKVKNRKAQVLPIAGTRKRGNTNEKDKVLEENLINDPKELAEHTMLMDLGRNDLNRICKYDTVNVIEMMKIQRYSHVMHIVSKIEGELRDDKDSIDALKACFPAGTVTGAPKIRAMQLIEEYESEARNVYAGAVGYFDFSGNLDMCIAIRTLFAKNKTIYWQAGAGIVSDSRPELEIKEIKNKSAVLVSALKYAGKIDEDISY